MAPSYSLLNDPNLVDSWKNSSSIVIGCSALIVFALLTTLLLSLLSCTCCQGSKTGAEKAQDGKDDAMSGDPPAPGQESNRAGGHASGISAPPEMLQPPTADRLAAPGFSERKAAKSPSLQLMSPHAVGGYAGGGPTGRATQTMDQPPSLRLTTKLEPYPGGRTRK